MPVKVRCPSCEKTLNAPDAARGKAIKCPNCQSKISVPAEGAVSSSGAVKKVAKKPVDDDDDFLAKLDINKSVDAESRICPKCGADIDEETTECPQCGVDPRTGQLTARRLKKMQLKGEDPADYYKEAFPDSWAFLLNNIGLAIKTGLFSAFLVVFAITCLFAATKCETMPPKVFWISMGVLNFVAMPGWYQLVTVRVVQATMGKKKKKIDKVRIDIPLCMSMGLTFIAWSIAFQIPGIAVVMVMKFMGMDQFMMAIAGNVIGLLMLPLWAPAMVHLSSAAPIKAYSMPHMLGLFFRVPGQCLFWCVSVIAANLAYTLATLGLVFFSMYYGLSALAYMMKEVLKQQPPGWVTAEASSMAGAIVVIVLFLLFYVISWILYGMFLIFSVRSLGLFGFYCKDRLDVVTKLKEVEYKRKDVKLDEHGNPIAPAWQKYGALVFALAACGGAGFIIWKFAM